MKKIAHFACVPFLYRIYDAAGSIQVDVAGLPDGVYVYHVKGKGDLLFTGKVSELLREVVKAFPPRYENKSSMSNRL